MMKLIIDNTYAQAYTEVLETLKIIPEYEFKKIPAKEIEFYENNKDKNYVFKIDSTKPIEQQISKKAKAVICIIYRDFFANEEEKENIQDILKIKEEIKQKEAREKYGFNGFSKNKTEVDMVNKNESNMLDVPQKSFFKKIILNIKKILKLT